MNQPLQYADTFLYATVNPSLLVLSPGENGCCSAASSHPRLGVYETIWPKFALCLHLWISETSSNVLARWRELSWRLGQFLLVEDLACEHLHLWHEDK